MNVKLREKQLTERERRLEGFEAKTGRKAAKDFGLEELDNKFKLILNASMHLKACIYLPRKSCLKV